jgi:hypothetical protein
LQARGQYWFSYLSLAAGSDKTKKAAERAVSRLRFHGAIANPYKGFYIIVPPEYRSIGCLPATWFIDDMMRFLSEQYYVGLLSAAELYGSAHHRPQELQVVVTHPLRRIECGKTRIRFFSKRHIEDTPITKHKTRTGFMQVSTAEATALDLVRYSFELGGLSSIAVVIAELCEALRPRRLVKTAAAYELATVQRLGFILEMLDQKQLYLPLSKWLAKLHPRIVSLRADKPADSAHLNELWRIKVNDEIDLEP